MSAAVDIETRTSGLGKAALIGAAVALVLSVSLFVGARYGLLLLIGLGFGVVLEGFRFGFAGPWRAMIVRREPGGVLAHLLSIGLVAVVAIPLLATNGEELLGARAPVGFAMIAGAFVFGACMQLVMGCGSGTLINAGSGNPVSLVALPVFAIGSFAGAYHLLWWTGLGALPVIALQGTSGALLTVAALALVAGLLVWLGAPGKRAIPRRYVIAAVLLAALALANFAVAGQPWGVVYGLGLWAAKGAQALGADVTASSFWGTSGNIDRLQNTLLTDVTSLTNIGLIGGAFLVASWRGGLGKGMPDLPARAWIATVIAGFLLGYSSRLAFGCNVGAFFSGISTGSLHGWVWFASAFAGTYYGIKLRPILGLEGRK
ncbi:YeeE/YedE family protein [Maribius pontilimi]|uniref:YeeE/YedE family protein n=1 Tax=Palleronia pontilimi TaxID=1964209 RepID=A0A934I7Y0_9RHOB|nr:YeeE/YedE family protein [Palleronia pontilimi]MBJ3762099.1 YeeE/YedE family protein [Palleronia pontilimi]